MAEPQQTIEGSLIITGDVEILGDVQNEALKFALTKIETISGEIQSVRAAVDTQLLSYGDDGVITPAEKLAIRSAWNGIEAEYPLIHEKATDKGIDTQIIDLYEDAYELLRIYLFGAPGILVNMEEVTEVDPFSYKGKIDYYTQNKESLLTAIDNANLTIADASQPPPDVINITAIAYKDYIEVRWIPQSGDVISINAALFILQRSTDGGTTWRDVSGTIDGDAKVQGTVYAFYFDRTTDGYPEKTEDKGWAPLSSYQFRVKAVNSAGVSSLGWKTCISVDASKYKTWIPTKPSGSSRTGMRTTTVSWPEEFNAYDRLRFDVQISKNAIDWYKPATGLDVYGDEENWRQDDEAGAFIEVYSPEWTQSLPLEGQSLGLPTDTTYYYRVRTVLDCAWTGSEGEGASSNGKRASDWSTPVTVLAKATSAYDLVQNAVTNAAVAPFAITANKIYVENLAAIQGLFASVAGGGDDFLNYWNLSDSPNAGRPTGSFRSGTANVYFRSNPGATGDVNDPYIELHAFNDYIKLHSGGIALKATTLEIDAMGTKLYSSLTIYKDSATLDMPLSLAVDGEGKGYIGFGEDLDYLTIQPNSLVWTDRVSFSNESIVSGTVLEDSTWETVFYEDWSDGYGDRWTNYAGSGELTVENGMLKVGNNSGNDQIWYIAEQSIEYDTNYLYRIGVGLIRTAGTGTAYAGFAGRNSADTEFINISGNNTYNSQHYFCFSNFSPSSYSYRFGYACGNSGTVTSPKNSELNPGVMYTGVAKIRALVLVNYSEVAGITYISPVVIQRKKKNSTTGYTLKTRTVLNNGELRFEGINSDGTIRLLNKLYIEDGALSTSGALYIGKGAVSEDVVFKLGNGRTASGYAYIDLIGDTTYTDYGLRIIRHNSGASADSLISHRGTGYLSIYANDAGIVRIGTSNTERMRILSNGNVLIGTTSDSGYRVSVSGGLYVSGSHLVTAGYVYGLQGRRPALYYAANGVIYRSALWSYLEQYVPSTEDVRVCSGGGTIDAASSSSGTAQVMAFGYIYRASSSEIRIYAINTPKAEMARYAIVTNSSTTLVPSNRGIVIAV